MSEGFIKFNRNEQFLEMIKARHSAYVLLSLVAYRARLEEGHIDGLSENQAYIGDYKSYGATRQIYRDDVAFLKRHGFITTKGTIKGTIATLCNDAIFDTNPTSKRTTKGTDRKNHQGTTNKEGKETKKYGTLESLGETEFMEIADSLKVPVDEVRDTYDAMRAKRSRYKYDDYKLALRNWVKGSIKKGTMQQMEIISL